MTDTTYTTLTRQSGLMREMQVIANNIANASTTGYRQEGVVFSEYVQASGRGDSLSMATARIGKTSLAQGVLQKTGGQFDLAIEGDGFFVIQTETGPKLTRAGNFSPNGAGDLVTAEGHPVLDAGGAPLFIPPDAGPVFVAEDGTLSAQDRILGQIGVVRPNDPSDLRREPGARFSSEGGWTPVEAPRVVQGHTEASNVDPILQLTRMIEVQRAYEMGQSFLDAEDKRIRSAISTLIR